MPSEIKVGDRVLVSHHPGDACRSPGCAASPLAGKVIDARPTPLGVTFTVRLPCGAVALYTDGLVEAV